MSEVSLSTSSSSLWESMNDWFTPKVFFVLLNVTIGTIVFISSLANHKQKHQNRQQNEQHSPKNASITRSPSVLQRLKSINLYAHYYRSHEESQNHNLDHNSHRRDYNSSDSDQTHHSFQDQYSQEYLRQAGQLKPQDSYVYEESERTQFVFKEKDRILDASSQAHEVKAQSRFIVYEQRDPTSSNGFSQFHEEESQTQFTIDETNDFTQTHEEKTSAAEQSMDEVYSQLIGGGIHFDRSKSDTKPRSGETPARMRKSASLKSAFGHFEEDEVISAESRRPATSRVSGHGDSEVDAKADDFINKFKQQLKLQRLDSIIRYKDMIARGSAKG